MTSRSVSASVSNAPRHHVAPRAADTYGDLAGDLSGDYGLTPDPWQQIILDDWLAEHRGKWAALTCGLSVPRQNGKNGVLEMRELFGTVGRGEKILHTAHEVKTAQKHFRRLKHFFGAKADDPGAKYPELNALVTEVRSVNGQEAIYLNNGGSVELVARSKNSGRGYTVDVLVMDEAQEMSEDALEALMPTTSSAPLGNPQWIFTGTPPGPKANGEVFTRVRDEAIGGKSKRLAWHEWSCVGAVDLDDKLEWHKANPALGTGRLQLDVVEGERARFSDDGFARERLGMWGSASSQAVIDAVTWARSADMMSQPVSRIALAVDVNPEQTAGSVSVAGLREDDRWHVELVDNRNGVGWIVERVVGIVGRQEVRAVVVDRDGPAAALIEPLEAHGVTVTTTGVREIKVGCASFYGDVMDDRLRHIDQPQLSASLAGARKRTVGDGWAWHRKNAAVDITPVVSATLALWGARSDSVQQADKPAVVYAF